MVASSPNDPVGQFYEYSPNCPSLVHFSPTALFAIWKEDKLDAELPKMRAPRWMFQQTSRKRKIQARLKPSDYGILRIQNCWFEWEWNSPEVTGKVTTAHGTRLHKTLWSREEQHCTEHSVRSPEGFCDIILLWCRSKMDSGDNTTGLLQRVHCVCMCV